MGGGTPLVPARRATAAAEEGSARERGERSPPRGGRGRAYTGRVPVIFATAVGLIAYTFVGYPAIVAALARMRPRPVRADAAHEPTVSIVIAAFNEADVIAARLQNCFALDYPRDRLEVLVVADGSDDATVEVARSFDGVRVLHRAERRGKLAAMNRAAAVARGDVLVFSDANNHYDRGALRSLVAPFADPEVGCVTGAKHIDAGSGRALDRAEGLYWRYESRLKLWESQIGSVTAVAGEILAFRSEAFPAVPAGTITEDFVQALHAAAAGWRVVYVPEAVSLERASATIGDESVRRSRLVTGRVQALARLLPALARRDPLLACAVVSHKGLRPLVPFALMAAAASSVPIAARRRWARAAVAAQAGFYAAAATGRQLERHGRRSRVLYLPYYFCRMNLATLTGIWRFVTGRHDAVWSRVRRA
jgi:poly-beta-1,6-N-acetyl-D-glucosamine synthase